MNHRSAFPLTPPRRVLLSTNPVVLPSGRSEGFLRFVCLLRKEVIQPLVPQRLPCYDFIPVAELALGACPLAVGTATSGAISSHDVTGGVYKARERIQGVVADTPLLAIPASCSRVADCNLN